MTHKATFVLVFVLLLSAAVFAQVPRIMNYQAKLTDSDGVALDGIYSITFRIYDAATGGNLLWYQTKTVTVTNGLFDVQLDLSINGGETLRFDQPYWITIKVGSDPEMTPREKLAPVSFAFRSIYSDTAGYVEGGAGDGNNYTTGISFSGTSTKTLTLSRNGLSDLTASFTDLVNDADHSTTNELQNLSQVLGRGNTSGAHDVVLNDAGAELKIMESSGGTYYGIFDVTDLSADRTYTFPNKSGTVAMTSDIPTSDNYGYWYAKDDDGTQYSLTSHDVLTFDEGSGIDVNFTGDDVLTITHKDLSSQSSVNNSGGTVIQDVSLDWTGHVTGLASVNLDSRYDKYNNWKLQANGGTTTDISSGETVNFQGSGATTVSRSGNTITISSTDNVNDADHDPTNEAQTLAGSGSSSITLSSVDGAGGGTITFSGSGATTVSRSGNTITIHTSSASAPSSCSELPTFNGMISWTQVHGDRDHANKYMCVSSAFPAAPWHAARDRCVSIGGRLCTQNEYRDWYDATTQSSAAFWINMATPDQAFYCANQDCSSRTQFDFYQHCQYRCCVLRK